MKASTSVYNIEASLPFADNFVKGVLARYGNNPVELAKIRIFLPNRRSVQSIKESFLRATKGVPLLLPQLHPLGDVDEHEQELFWFSNNIEIATPISPTEEQIVLARLICRWREDINFPQSLMLAKELARFLNEVAKEQISFESLSEIVPEDLSKHWQLTLDFLNILIREYPNILSERQQINHWTYRNNVLDDLCEHWKLSPPDTPVIVAGSTGSIPATSNLLNTIANLRLGSVVLPGLDISLDESSWKKLDITHPQYGLKLLTEVLDVSRKDIRSWHNNVTSDNSSKQRFLSDIMLPEESSIFWHRLEAYPPNALKNIEIISADNQQEEALAIAVAMRESLEIPEKTCALITHDNSLSRMVSSFLKQWDIDIDNSAGSPLAYTPSLIFMQAIADLVASRMSPITLLEMLKHPLCCAKSFTRIEHLNNTRKLETKFLRGVRVSEGLDGLLRITKEDKSSEKIYKWLSEIKEALSPLDKLLNKPQVLFSEIISIHLKSAQNLCENDNLWQGEKGDQSYTAIAEIMIASNSINMINSKEYNSIFLTLLQGKTYRPRYGSHPRLFILSPIESRLQQYDRVILGGLNENSWPPAVTSDPWMSRPMRESFGLPLPERKIGMSAHDFVQNMSAKQVILTRAKKIEGTQTLPSRWLMRLEAVLTSTGQSNEVISKNSWLEIAKTMLKSDKQSQCLEPTPCPPLDFRPKKLSVTSIEKLLRDPYNIYANKILNLNKLDDLDQDPGAAEFGLIIHEALEDFIKNIDNFSPEYYETNLLKCGENAFAKQELRPAIKSFWWPRFKRIASWFVENEKKRKKNISEIKVETWGEYILNTKYGSFKIFAKADRVEKQKDGSVWLIDYKTGTPPTSKEVQLGYACQLTLEALIFKNGGFENDKNNNIDFHTEYWKLSGTEIAGKISPTPKDINQYIKDAESGVVSLIEHFQQENNPYLVAPNPDFALRYNDYMHLSRQKEWGDVN